MMETVPLFVGPVPHFQKTLAVNVMCVHEVTGLLTCGVFQRAATRMESGV